MKGGDFEDDLEQLLSVEGGITGNVVHEAKMQREAWVGLSETYA